MIWFLLSIGVVQLCYAKELQLHCNPGRLSRVIDRRLHATLDPQMRVFCLQMQKRSAAGFLAQMRCNRTFRASFSVRKLLLLPSPVPRRTLSVHSPNNSFRCQNERFQSDCRDVLAVMNEFDKGNFDLYLLSSPETHWIRKA
jgi:hypothetical protein